MEGGKPASEGRKHTMPRGVNARMDNEVLRNRNERGLGKQMLPISSV